tara:strand:+ start:67 stop:651 length:585 start_codon:yes stop_codon:yes gene_type:complete
MTHLKVPSKSAIYRQIKDHGISKAIVKRVLPDWWDDELLNSKSGFLKFSKVLNLRLRLNTIISDDGIIEFSPSNFSTQFKKRAHIDRQQLINATYLCQAVAKTMVRALRCNELEQDVVSLHETLLSIDSLTLSSVLPLFWQHNLPVIHINKFPSNVARPAGMVMREHGLYVIILGHKQKSPSTQLFVLLHELGT